MNLDYLLFLGAIVLVIVVVAFLALGYLFGKVEAECNVTDRDFPEWRG